MMPNDPIPAAAVEAYRPQPMVYEDSPSVEYVTRDCPVVHDRVDGWLSLIRDMATNEIVGACIDLPAALPHLSSPAVAALNPGIPSPAREEIAALMAPAGDVEGLVERLREMVRHHGAGNALMEAVAALTRIAVERDEARRRLEVVELAFKVRAGLLSEVMTERDALAERVKAAESLVRQRDRLAENSRTFWVRAGKAALAGNASELRNRIALAEAPPAEVVLSETTLTQASADPTTEDVP